MARRILPASLMLLLLPALAWSQAPIGSEFQVNTYTTGVQYFQSIAADANGNFVVVWQSNGQDGSGPGIFGRYYDAAGTPLGGAEFRVNSYTTTAQQYPQVASSSTGDIVVVWESYPNQDGSSTGVFGRQFNAVGAPVGAEFVVNTYTTGPQSFPAVASDANGDFVVVWSSDDGSNQGVFARRFDAAGSPQGSPFQVNSFTTGTQDHPSVAAQGSGGFVVAWQSQGQDGNNYAVVARRYDAAGIPQGAEFRVNTYSTDVQGRPRVALDASGNFVVVWSSLGQDSQSYGVFGQRYDSTGAAVGAEFQVNSYTSSDQYTPSVAFDAGGSFMVLWQSVGQSPDRSGGGIFGRRYDSSGVAQGPELLINTYTTNDQRFPAVAPGSGGSFVVVWQSPGQDGSGNGVFGQRSQADLIFADDFEEGSLSAWSAGVTDSGDLGVSAFAALNSTTVGLQGVVDDTNGIYVQDDAPNDESRYRARFYFDPNGFDPGEAQSHFRTRIFLALEENPIRRLVAVVLKRQAGAYSLMGRCRLNDGTQADTGFFPVSNAPHVIEIDWRRASSAVAVDGQFELFIDGSSVSALSGLANGVSAVDFARMGALSVKTGAAGTLYWDEFVSRRASYIGP
jgi:hypothetical protein